MNWQIELNEFIEVRIARGSYESLTDAERAYHAICWLRIVFIPRVNVQTVITRHLTTDCHARLAEIPMTASNKKWTIRKGNS